MRVRCVDVEEVAVARMRCLAKDEVRIGVDRLSSSLEHGPRSEPRPIDPAAMGG